MKQVPLKRFGSFGGSKFGNLPVTIDGISFQSTLEGARFLELKHMEKAGEIRDLQRQVTFQLLGADGKKIGKRYIADFCYYRGEEYVREDVKGKATADFKLKAAVMAAQGEPITLVMSRDVAHWARETAREIRESGLKYTTGDAA